MLRSDTSTALGGDEPLVSVFIEVGASDACVECNVVFEIKAICNVLGILEKLGLRRVFLGPVPLLLKLF